MNGSQEMLSFFLAKLFIESLPRLIKLAFCEIEIGMALTTDVDPPPVLGLNCDVIVIDAVEVSTVLTLFYSH